MTPLTVFLVDDDRAVCDSIVWMLKQEGINVKAFLSPSALLHEFDPSSNGCLVLDLQLPEMTGLELHSRLRELGCDLPFMIITGCGEVPDATAAMRMGALDFIEKPVYRKTFLQRVWQALDEATRRRQEKTNYDDVQRRIDKLTKREREVLELVVAGKLTKQIARQLGVTVKTIEAHRSNVTKKMQVDSAIQLVRMVTQQRAYHSPAGISPPNMPIHQEEATAVQSGDSVGSIADDSVGSVN